MKENKFIKIFNLLFLKKLNNLSLTEGFRHIYKPKDFKFVLLNSNAKLKLVSWHYPVKFMSLFGNYIFISEEEKKEKKKVISLYENFLTDSSITDIIHTYFIMSTTGYHLNTDDPICIISDMEMVDSFLQKNCESLTKNITDNLTFNVIDPNTINVFFSQYDVTTTDPGSEYFDPEFKLELKCAVGFKDGVDVYKNDEDADMYEKEKLDIADMIYSFMEDRFDEWYVSLELDFLEL